MESPQGLDFIVNNQINPQIIGYFNDEKNDLKVAHTQITFDHLIDIIGKITFLFEYDSQKRQHLILNSRGYKSDTYYILSEDLYIKDNMVTKKKTENKHTHSYYELSFLKLFRDQKTSDFSRLRENANYIKNLFEFIIGTPLHFESIEFQTQKTTVTKNIPKNIGFDTSTVMEWREITETLPEIKGRYFYRQIGEPKELKNTHFYNYNNISYNNNFENFKYLLNNWYEKKEKLAFITESYLNDLTLPYFTHTKLLNAIRNLEVFYRNFREKQPTLSKNYLHEREIIAKFIKENTVKKYKEKFISQVEYVGESSLRKKLNTLFKELPEKLFNETIKEEGASPSKCRTNFINRLVDNRNFRTHGDSPEKYPNKILDSFEALQTTKKLSLIQQFLILKELGLDHDSIMEFEFK